MQITFNMFVTVKQNALELYTTNNIDQDKNTDLYAYNSFIEYLKTMEGKSFEVLKYYDTKYKLLIPNEGTINIDKCLIEDLDVLLLDNYINSITNQDKLINILKIILTSMRI